MMALKHFDDSILHAAYSMKINFGEILNSCILSLSAVTLKTVLILQSSKRTISQGIR